MFIQLLWIDVIALLIRHSTVHQFLSYSYKKSHDRDNDVCCIFFTLSLFWTYCQLFAVVIVWWCILAVLRLELEKKNNTKHVHAFPQFEFFFHFRWVFIASTCGNFIIRFWIFIHLNAYSTAIPIWLEWVTQWNVICGLVLLTNMGRGNGIVNIDWIHLLHTKLVSRFESEFLVKFNDMIPEIISTFFNRISLSRKRKKTAKNNMIAWIPLKQHFTLQNDVLSWTITSRGPPKDAFENCCVLSFWRIFPSLVSAYLQRSSH